MRGLGRIVIALAVIAGGRSWAQEPAATAVEADPFSGGSLYLQAAAQPAAAVERGDPNGGEAPKSAMAAHSLFYVAPAERKKFKKHDYVTVVIREDSESSSKGSSQSKKDQNTDLAFQQWAQLGLDSNGLPTAAKVKAPSKLPEIAFKYANDRKNDASQDRSDKFSARIQAEIIDIKPNGALVIQATKQIFTDGEEQKITLAGACRAEDVGPDNSVLSTQLADLKLSKETSGQVHDGTKRGWLNGIIDVLSPF